jgi:hypothetical protein
VQIRFGTAHNGARSAQSIFCTEGGKGLVNLCRSRLPVQTGNSTVPRPAGRPTDSGSFGRADVLSASCCNLHSRLPPRPEQSCGLDPRSRGWRCPSCLVRSVKGDSLQTKPPEGTTKSQRSVTSGWHLLWAAACRSPSGRPRLPVRQNSTTANLIDSSGHVKLYLQVPGEKSADFSWAVMPTVAAPTSTAISFQAAEFL